MTEGQLHHDTALAWPRRNRRTATWMCVADSTWEAERADRTGFADIVERIASKLISIAITTPACHPSDSLRFYEKR